MNIVSTPDFARKVIDTIIHCKSPTTHPLAACTIYSITHFKLACLFGIIVSLIRIMLGKILALDASLKATTT